MSVRILILLLFLVSSAHSQSPSDPPVVTPPDLAAGAEEEPPSAGRMKSEPHEEGKRKLEQEVIVPARIEDVWRAWTTTEGVTSFFAPGAEIELAANGPYRIYFDVNAKSERGCGDCRVVSFEPMRSLTFTWAAPPHLPTLVTVTLQEHGVGSTRVRLTQEDWGVGEEWDQAFLYFEKAWRNVLGNLEYRFVKGPVEWKDGRFTTARLEP